MNVRQKTAFTKAVYGYYEEHGRHDLPWRTTKDPYAITVSEIMLQQTQVRRVIEKYHEFMKAFPNAAVLAQAPLQQVLLHWSGLGYNRRARFLHQMAQTIVKEYNGTFPKDFEGLVALPGIGHYTAGAIMAFAFNKPHAFIETNIRTVYLHHFPKVLSLSNDKDTKVSDKELMPLIEATIDQKNPQQWYWALMDYGSYLKNQGVKIHRKSAHYAKQSAFKGSVREVRGSIMKILTTQKASAKKLQVLTGFSIDRIDSAIESLIKEGMVSKKGILLGIS